VVVISYVLGPTAAAFCFVATRITAVFPMIAGAITGYASSRISRLFYAGAKEELGRVLHSLAVISTLLAGGAGLAIALAGKLLLATFGPIYVEVFSALIVLAVGSAATALTGPAAYLLLLTGNERTYPRILAWGLLSRFILLAGLGHWFGLMGAVAALGLSNIVMSVALVLACRRLVGLDPSLLGAVWHRFPSIARPPAS
jgi:O-antigen/teichoic acid export membrane protein